jgi:hypothetical protein
VFSRPKNPFPPAESDRVVVRSWVVFSSSGREVPSAAFFNLFDGP